MDFRDYTATDEENEIIRIIEEEKNNWIDGNFTVAEGHTYSMKDILKKARLNYFGVFEKEPFDPVTKRKKLFYQLTESVLKDVIKNIDIDTKDIKTIATNPLGFKKAYLQRKILQHKLDKINFGLTLNKAIFYTGLDGTGFMKTWKEKNEDGKMEVKIAVKDRLNILVDPTIEELDDSSAIIERNWLTIEEFKRYEDYKNKEYVEGEKYVDNTGIDMEHKNNETSVPYVELYERYGWFLKIWDRFTVFIKFKYSVFSSFKTWHCIITFFIVKLSY